jgi:hypothetical protein
MFPFQTKKSSHEFSYIIKFITLRNTFNLLYKQPCHIYATLDKLVEDIMLLKKIQTYCLKY